MFTPLFTAFPAAAPIYTGEPHLWRIRSTNGDGAWVSADTAYQTVINEIQGRKTPVILMHDGEKKESTVESLPRIIETLLSQGYAFDRLTPSSPLVQQGISWDP